MNQGDEKRVVLLETADCPLEAAGDILSRHGLQVRATSSLRQVLASIRARQVDLVVARLCHGCRQALELLSSLGGKSDAPPVLVVTAGADVRLYLEAMQRGAFDCVAVPVDEQEMIRIVARALAPQQECLASAGGE